MDPNKTLADLRDYARSLLDEVDRANKTGVADFSSPEEAYTMAEQLEALDDWLSRGGFLPDDWQSLSRARLEVVESEVRQKQQSLSDWMNEHKREQELERARKHTYRPYDTSGQDRA